MTTSGIFTRKDNTQSCRERYTEETSEQETLLRVLFYICEFGKLANAVESSEFDVNINFLLIYTEI